MRKDRVAQVYFYEWSVSRWLASEARAELDLAARGLYRECLDLCYANGSIPKEPAVLARLCHCTTEEIETLWPRIERHFQTLRSDKNRAGNQFADMFRRGFFKYKKKQKQNGQRGGRPKVKEGNDMETTGLNKDEPNGNPKSRKQKQKADTEKGKQAASGAGFEKPNGAQPQSRRRSPDEIDKMGSLLWGASEGSPVAAGPPDKHLAESILNAIGDLDTAEKWLAEKMAQGKRPKTSYQYWVTLACAEFVDGRHP